MPIDVETRKRDSDNAIIALAIISHPDFSQPVRVAANGEDITSDGETFFGWPWELKRPDEGESADYEAEITIDNIDPEIVTALMASTVPPTITIQLILASAPDDVEQELANFKLKNVEFDAATIKGALGLTDLRDRPVCCKTFLPSISPGLF